VGVGSEVCAWDLRLFVQEQALVVELLGSWTRGLCWLRMTLSHGGFLMKGCTQFGQRTTLSHW
jgi:hypothetical protein